VFGHADHDRSMTPARVAELAETLRDAGVGFRNEVYPDAPHGYTMSDTSECDAAACARHFTELRELLSSAVPGSSRG